MNIQWHPVIVSSDSQRITPPLTGVVEKPSTWRYLVGLLLPAVLGHGLTARADGATCQMIFGLYPITPGFVSSQAQHHYPSAPKIENPQVHQAPISSNPADTAARRPRYMISASLRAQLAQERFPLSIVEQLVKNQQGRPQLDRESSTNPNGSHRYWFLARDPNVDYMYKMVWAFTPGKDQSPTLIAISPSSIKMEKFYYARNAELDKTPEFTFELNKKTIEGFSTISVPPSVQKKLAYKHSVSLEEVVNAFIRRDVRQPLRFNRDAAYACCASYYFYTVVDGRPLKVIIDLDKASGAIVVLTTFEDLDGYQREGRRHDLH